MYVDWSGREQEDAEMDNMREETPLSEIGGMQTQITLTKQDLFSVLNDLIDSVNPGRDKRIDKVGLLKEWNRLGLEDTVFKALVEWFYSDLQDRA